MQPHDIMQIALEKAGSIIDERLPARLQGTDRHLNCPDLPVVDVISRHDPTVAVRPMVFLGTLQQGT
ncbi:unnamed protein product, partial [marine sediment metagenome]